jgi:hypothetical protein
MAADTTHPNLEASAARRHSLNRKVRQPFHVSTTSTQRRVRNQPRFRMVTRHTLPSRSQVQVSIRRKPLAGVMNALTPARTRTRFRRLNSRRTTTFQRNTSAIISRTSARRMLGKGCILVRCLTARMSYEEERVTRTRTREEADRAPPHWLNPVVRLPLGHGRSLANPAARANSSPCGESTTSAPSLKMEAITSTQCPLSVTAWKFAP